MEKIWRCKTHDKGFEIYCDACKNYICVECISNHEEVCANPKFVHVFKHATEVGLPKIDKMLEEMTSTDSEIASEANSLMGALSEIAPQLKQVITEHHQSSQILKSLVSQLESKIIPSKQQPISEQIRMGLTSDKKRLENALKDDEMQTVITLTKKIIGESEVSRKTDFEKPAIQKIKAKIATMDYINSYKELTDCLTQLSSKCQRLRLGGCITSWKCDTRYLSRKMSLTPDGLTIGNTSGDGYPAIIGDTPIDTGICIYEVVPTGLNCTGTEGFGIIELEKYKTIQAANADTPTVGNDIIGYMYSNEAKNMTAVRSKSMEMGSKYIVRVDMNNLTMTIKGNDLLLTASLKPATVYVPCFSTGCTGNKFAIKPLDFDADIDP